MFDDIDKGPKNVEGGVIDVRRTEEKSQILSLIPDKYCSNSFEVTSKILEMLIAMVDRDELDPLLICHIGMSIMVSGLESFRHFIHPDQVERIQKRFAEDLQSTIRLANVKNIKINYEEKEW